MNCEPGGCLLSKYRAAVIGLGWMGMLYDLRPGLGRTSDRFNVDDIDRPTPELEIHRKFHYHNLHLVYGHTPTSYAEALWDRPEVDLVSGCDRDTKRLKIYQERYGVKNVYTDAQEMLQKEDLDIVSVTTPSHARALPIIFAAENGVRGIYAEKGLCSSLAEADDIYRAIKSNKVAFNWGAMRRHHDGYLKLKKAISEGEIGTPMYVMVFALTDLIKHHPHTLDTVATLIGDPRPLWVEGSFLSKEELISKMGGDESKLSKICLLYTSPSPRD